MPCACPVLQVVAFDPITEAAVYMVQGSLPDTDERVQEMQESRAELPRVLRCFSTVHAGLLSYTQEVSETAGD